MKANNERRFLIILPRQLGDILLGSSIAFALRAAYPKAHITWLSHPMGRQLLTGHPALNEVLFHPLFRPNSRSGHRLSLVRHLLGRLSHVVHEVSFLLRLRRMKFDTAVDVICTPRTAILSMVSGAATRIGIRTRWNRNWAYNQLIDASDWGSQYAAVARLQLISSLIDPQLCSAPPPQWLRSWIPKDDNTVRKVQLWMQECELSQRNFIVLSPTHRRPLRRWPVNHYVELAANIMRDTKCKIVWLWGPGEKDIVDSGHAALIAREPSANTRSLVPPLFSLPEVAELCRNSAVWIGNSNGLSHVAMAGGARTIQIHGPTHSAPWTHPESLNHKSIQRESGCVRCESNVCKQKTHECMTELSVASVYEQFKSFKKA